MHSAVPASDSKPQVRSHLSRWTGTVPPGRRPLFVAFVEEVLQRLRGPFLQQHTPELVLELLEEAFHFVERRNGSDVRTEIRPRPAKGGIALLVNMPDQPFIVDTTRLFLKTRAAEFWGGFNVVVRISRDADGRMVGVGQPDGRSESIVIYEADTADLGAPGAADTLRRNLEHAQASVRDFEAMVQAIKTFAQRAEQIAAHDPGRADAARETAAFLSWLVADNFVLLGMDADGTPLGIQAMVDSPFIGSNAGEWPEPNFPGTVSVRKSALESPIHRSGRIDEILVRLEGVGELFVRGMFTYRAITLPSRHVPILRRMLADILAGQTAGPGSHRYKGLANVFDTLPTEFLFTASRGVVAQLLDRVFDAEQQQEAGVSLLMSGGDSAFCLAAMPKAQYGDELRRAIEQQLLAVTKATYCDHGVFVGRYDTVLLHYFLTGVTDPGADAIQALTEQIRTEATPWLSRLFDALTSRLGHAEADRLTDIWGRAFPEGWSRDNSVERTVRDIEMLEALTATRKVQADVYQDGRDLILRVYQAVDVYLTQLLPVLSNFGIEVIDSYASQVHGLGGTLHIDTFRLAGARGIDRGTLLARGPLLVDTIAEVFAERVSADRMNGLVLVAGLTASEVDMLRGYMRYSRQVGMKLSIRRMTEVFLAHPVCVNALVKLFHARFDPDLQGDRAAIEAAARDLVIDELRYVQAHDEDLLLSTVRNLIEATVRTNYYRTDKKGAYLSFKFDAAKINSLGHNRPMFEIYVHAREVEGVHLRFGKVARGGLRWSDRDDYRTEVLGLVTTQRVKNVVIVPTGSKGGFFLKNAHPDMAERRRQADQLYKTFIRGLLDVTDNSVDGKIVPPPRVVRHDPDDHYLVVAADKGTAHLSDTANAISLEYGFWLGDAFASGGSNGYDHKKVGITARGAWVLVKRHFAELGKDPYARDTITAIGVGDMGGDVFGNGLIESNRIRLLAAFNHLHIFLDPDPDPAKSHAERLRLFRAVGGWDKYDASLISEGGGVFDRRAKIIPLSPQCQAMLGIHKAEAQPEEVMNAILKMDVDLFWNGGIGTYVRATSETDADADDKSNDAIRVSASQLRAKVIGEGGNLGLTQKARIELGLRGVRINNDAVDNSAGVDLSDHEVNLKILLSSVMARGALGSSERNQLLEAMTDEVAQLVLTDNDAHGRQLSCDEIRSQRNLFQFGRAIAFIEREFGRDRSTLDLPSSEEIERRIAAGQGLTRPELAVLSSWVKMYVKRELLKATLDDIPGASDLLRTYFPERIQATYPEDITSHMLAKEIVITVAVTRMFADAGAAYFPTMIEGVGATALEITQAYLKAQRVARVEEARAELQLLRNDGSMGTAYGLWVELDNGTREVATFWLSSAGRIPDDVVLEQMREAAPRVHALQTADVAASDRAAAERMASIGVTGAVAKIVLEARSLNVGLAAWAESNRSGLPLETIAARQLAVGRASRLQSVLDDLATRPASGRWDPLALRILHTRFQALLRALVGKCQTERIEGTVEELEAALASGRIRAVRRQVDDVLGAEKSPSVSTLMVLEERVSGAVTRL
ncbi:MAG: NAD-glutamate dehydrogenase [Alphaproteobacteria bacterium]|nr:NAD-glutamate dehydrogenase [Alphaproteobacteria bacterium]